MNKTSISEMVEWIRRIGYQVCFTPSSIAHRWRVVNEILYLLLIALRSEPPECSPRRRNQGQGLYFVVYHIDPLAVCLRSVAESQPSRPVHLPPFAIRPGAHRDRQCAFVGGEICQVLLRGVGSA